MLTELNSQNLHLIKNIQFRQYAEIYINVSRNFLEQIKGNGLELDNLNREEITKIWPKLETQGAILRNDSKSIYTNWLSPACEACRKGENSTTFYLSLKCHRSCYYCFNPNQEGYDYYTSHNRDCISELSESAKRDQKLSFIALTGGEPLLYKQETIEFFQCAKEKFPRAHTRLYTSGDLLDQETLKELKDAGLDEIRFSIKMEDSEKLRRKVLDNLVLAKDYIPFTMVEMPVIPGSLPDMKDLLLELNRIGIAGINLLEFCFPYHNVQEFLRRDFKVKNPPYLVLYDYWYAGGLPVAGSEEECLALLEFALTEKMQMGVHYCSLENKHTGQVYQQNKKENRASLTYSSHKDFFLKTAKVFGEDIPEVLKVFKKKKINDHRMNEEYQFLEFHVSNIRQLKKLNVEVGISSSIMEERNGEKYLRELKIELADPEHFDIRMI